MTKKMFAALLNVAQQDKDRGLPETALVMIKPMNVDVQPEVVTLLELSKIVAMYKSSGFEISFVEGEEK